MNTHKITSIICFLLALSAVAAAVPEQRTASRIFAATGVKGGLIVHVDCGDGKLTAALRAGDSYLVHGLDTGARNIDKARAHIRSLGLYGKVSVEHFDGDRLPYIDNSVNLVVSEDLGRISKSEVMRVLVPKGVAYIKSQGRWEKKVKTRPQEIDEWTHYATDCARCVQW
ncbi:MAG: class I SAM-dependent methyltransferase [Planctomycetota bacterium]|jgi:SAM-dependent methyltransferase